MRVLFFTIVALYLLSCSNALKSTSYSPSSFRLSGVVQLARVRNATVRVYALNSNGSEGALLAQTTTNSEGEYLLTLPRKTGSVIVKSSGGKFDDEADQVEKDGVELSAISQGGTNDVAPLTPMSTLEADRVKVLLPTSPSLAQARTNAKSEVSKLFGLNASDLSSVPDPPNALSTNSSKMKSALSIAAFSHFVQDFYLSDLNPNTKLATILTSMREDFKTDGKLDGSVNSNTAKKVAGLWSTKMPAAKNLAVANNALEFRHQNTNVVNSVSSFETGNSKTGEMSDGYYLSGIKTTLNNQGNGVWLETCFSDGKDTGDLETGTGTCSTNNLYYRGGSPASGFYNNICYIDGEDTAEVVSGTGTCSATGKHYVSGTPASGVYNSTCYSNGIDTGDLVSGTGTCSVTGKYYANGALANGVFNSICYVNGSDTGDLVSGTGTCTATGKYYSSGAFANGVFNYICYVNGSDTGDLIDGNGKCSYDEKVFYHGAYAQVADGPMADGKFYANGVLANGLQGGHYYADGIISEGCTAPLACNYNPSVVYDDGSCVYTCADNTIIYTATATDDHIYNDVDSALADSTVIPGNYAWLSYRSTSLIQKRSITDGSWVSDIFLPDYGGSAMLFRTGQFVWAFSNSLTETGAWRINQTTDEIVNYTGIIPQMTIGASSEEFIWILGSGSPMLYKIDGDSGDIITTKDLSEVFSSSPQAIAVGSNLIGITGDSKLVFLDKTSLEVQQSIPLPDSNSGFNPTLAYVLREGEGGWFVASGGDRSALYRYDYASQSGRFLNITLDSIESIAQDATGFWISNTHNYVEAAYLYHIKFDGTIDRRLDMDHYYGFKTDWSGAIYPKTFIAPDGRVWLTSYNPFRLLIMNWMSY